MSEPQPLRPFGDVFRGKTVLVTGHTGFKGTWVALWLRELGANVVGYSLDPPSVPSMFVAVDAKQGIKDIRADVRDRGRIAQAIKESQPDVVLHMAAQSLVRRSYKEPLETLETNVLGTANLLEGLRHLQRPCAVVVVTSDKCYENVNSHLGYREIDPLGGSDPYSMSKGAQELVVASWRRSFFGDASPVRVASARAGNVVGGGDWANDRITTDCVLALCSRKPIKLRSPRATRPWQHVLEPLSGYLWLAAKLMSEGGKRFDGAWNFGPAPQSVCSVETFAKMLVKHWGEGSVEAAEEANAPHEAALLSLSWEKAFQCLGWQPTWTLEECLRRTAAWYKAWHAGKGGEASLRELSLSQIRAFQTAAAQIGNQWIVGDAQDPKLCES